MGRRRRGVIKSSKGTEKFAETDLYEPVRQLLTGQGFVVKGEVKRCDITAVRDDLLWIVEMKLHFNITLLYQALERQRISKHVFVAVPRPKKANDKNFRNMQRIIKKLELGLITVALDSPIRTAEIVIFPDGKPGKKTKAEASVRREMAGRTGDTAGGSVKARINTAYREKCIRIACVLERTGSMTAPQLIKQYHCEKDAYTIMYHNYYDWFRKTGKGLFSLTNAGQRYLDDNENGSVVAYYRLLAAECISENDKMD